jgi:type 1 glutamine amidotransferase
MKTLASFLLSIAVVIAASRPALADQPAKGEKIRVLLTVGGHGYEEAPFYAMWDALPGVKWTKIELPKQADLLKPGLEKEYDVIAMYDMCPGIKPEQQEAFAALLKKGIGVVSMHHNLGAHQKWDEFRKIIGGKFCTAENTIDGAKVKQATWDHDQDVNVTVVDKEHPITKGIEDFQIHDETYGGCWISPKVKVLLKTDHPKNKPGQIAWVTKYGNSPVAHIMLGHDSQAWKNPNYPKLLLQAIQWAACR